MDMNESGILTVLEQLLEEFFNSTASNARKHEIERQLGQVKNLPEFGKLCLFIITNSSSQLATMFALSSLETVINQQWMMIDCTYKEELKTVLYGYLIEKGITAPHYLRNKHAKLLVDIAKQDWPVRYPHYFTNILELLKNEQARLIGLILLRTTSEEFMGPNSNFNSERKEEVTRLMQHYIPLAFEILTEILQNLDIKPKHSETTTPPPSPTHPTSPHNFPHHFSAASFKTDAKSLKKELLLTLQHLFSWTPIQQIPSDLIPCIFGFTNVCSYAQDDDDMCILAMCTLNEILYRRCTPPGTQDFFLHLYQHTVQLLRDIVCPTSGRIETLSPDFVEKLTELITLLIEQHLWRLEMEPRFNAMEFLSLLYQLTMQLSSPQCYLHCLSVWNAFIKQIKQQNAHKYSEVFHGLVAAILKKIQFTYNNKQLESADKESVDEQSDSERQFLIKSSIEVIALIAEYAPIDVFNQVLAPWKVCGEIYFSFLNCTVSTNFLSNSEEIQKLCFFVKDFSSLTQLSARLSSLFVDQDNDDVNKMALPMLDGLTCKLLECATLAMNNRFYEKSQVPSEIQEALVDVFGELLAALKTWLVWLNQNAATSSVQMKQLVDVALKTLHLSVDTYIPEKVLHAAAHLLLGITEIVFPPHLITLPPILQLIHRAPTMAFKKAETKLIMSSAMCNLLLRPWGELSQEDTTQRNYLIGLYFDTLTREFRELSGASEEVKIKRVVGNTLPVLAYCVDYSKKFTNASKKLLCAAIKPSVEHALFLFPNYVKYPEISNHILVLFLNVLSVLQQQIGVDGTKNAVQVFLQVAVSEQANNLTGLDKLLQILQFVIEAPGMSYKNFLPGILELSLKNVYPVIINQASDYPDVYIALLTLLHSILSHRWQYFYISQVRLGYSPGCSETEIGPETPQHSEQFLCVLEVFGQALLQQDLNIFRIGLAAIEDLNNKWKLYQKILFKDRLLGHFITILLQTILHKTHALLNEDIQIAVYNMASVNFDFFFNSLLQRFVASVDGVTAEQWDIVVRNFIRYHDKDMPTFLQHLQRFIDDTRHYRMCNLNITTVLTS